MNMRLFGARISTGSSGSMAIFSKLSILVFESVLPGKMDSMQKRALILASVQFGVEPHLY